MSSLHCTESVAIYGDKVSRIKTILKQLGMPNLIGLYGEQNVESITNILHEGVNEIKLVELLFIKYGKQILSNKSVRLAVLTKLSEREKGYILDGRDEPSRELSREELECLTKLRWGRKQKSSSRLLFVLDLDDEYLPSTYEQPLSKEIISPNTYLFPHQRRVKDDVTRLLINGQDRLLVHMPTGAGKTRTVIEAIIDYWKAYSNRATNIIWLAHSEELCEQAVETFKVLWEVRGDQDINLYRFWSNHDVPDFSVGNSFIVASFQKLYSMISSSDNHSFQEVNSLKRTCNFIIVDEAHKAIAPTYKICISYLFNENLTKLVGLTATPGRSKDDMDNAGLSYTGTDELAEFFGRNKVSITNDSGDGIEDPIGFLQGKGFLSSIKRKKVRTNVEIELSEKEREFVANFLEIPKSILNKLAKDDSRNALILSEVASLRLDQKQIIIFALSVEHAHLITELLNLKGITARCIDGKTSPSDRVNSIVKYKQNEISVLVNYGVLTTGFDAPNTNAIIITRPTASLVLYSQMIGRGIRGPKVGGNLECNLIDLEDNLLGFPSEQQAFNYFNSAWK
ncbi:MAG: DEAD/DEAH box helicase [Methylococcaceae bacterium]|nr:DEAD/DEAH box helicase [Methylococcaceae bacterium]